MNIKTILKISLYAAGCAGAVLAPIFAYKAAKKPEPEKKPETKKEKVVHVVKKYGPTVAATVASVGCFSAVIGLQLKDISILTASATAASSELIAFKNKLKDKNPELYKDIEEELAKDISFETITTMTADEKAEFLAKKKDNPYTILVYDSSDDRYISTTREDIYRALNVINKKFNENMCVNLNEFYKEIGAKESSSDVGWSKVDGVTNNYRHINVELIPSDTSDDYFTLKWSHEPTIEGTEEHCEVTYTDGLIMPGSSYDEANCTDDYSARYVDSIYGMEFSNSEYYTSLIW